MAPAENRVRLMIGSSPWSTLPSELLACVAKRLDTHFDLLRFRAVCQSWRASIPAPKRSPPLPVHLRFLTDGSIDDLATYNVARRTIFRIEPDDSGPESYPPNTAWLIKVQEESDGNKMRVINPFTRLQMQSLPDTFPKELNMLNFRITQISSTYSIDRFDNAYYSDEVFTDSELDADTDVDAAFDANAGAVVEVDEEDEDDINDGTLCSKVMFTCDPNSDNIADQRVFSIIDGELFAMKTGDHHWKSVDCADTYRDLTSFNGKIYAVIRSGLASINTSVPVSSPSTSRLILPPRSFNGERYLVQSCGELFLVSRELSMYQDQVFFDEDTTYFVKKVDGDFVPFKFAVFKLNDANDHPSSSLYRWEEISDIGDRILCVCRDCSYSIAAQDFAGCKGNCIYFIDELEDGYDYCGDLIDDTDIFVYNLEDGEAGPLASFPQFPNIFWPPPVWFRANDPPAAAPET